MLKKLEMNVVIYGLEGLLRTLLISITPKPMRARAQRSKFKFMSSVMPQRMIITPKKRPMTFPATGTPKHISLSSRFL